MKIMKANGSKRQMPTMAMEQREPTIAGIDTAMQCTQEGLKHENPYDREQIPSL